MKEVFLVSDNIYSPLGQTTAENLLNLKQKISGVRKREMPIYSEQPFYASMFEDEFSGNGHGSSKFEELVSRSVKDAVSTASVDTADRKTIFILSSTKGNISLLEQAAYSPGLAPRFSLSQSASLVSKQFGFVNDPVVVSNACISGILAMVMGMRLLQSGQYETAVVTGADVISKFVLSGFQSFQAVSAGPCKPFDAERDGINLGEGAATVVLSSVKRGNGISISGGAVTNDANHISGPSRTGEELAMAISRSMKNANVDAADIDIISAHGTATVYNDEMEAKAITLSRLQHAPVNSLKGYYGHTLGAAGIIESVVTSHSLLSGLMYPTIGFSKLGVSIPLNVSNNLQSGNFRHALKTASGFGGCNAAMVISKQIHS